MLPCGIYNESYSQELTFLRTRTHKVLMIVAIAVALIGPLVLQSAAVNWLTLVTLTITSALGLAVTMGYCGLPSIGHAAFMAIGAFAYANFTKLGVPIWLAIVAGGIISGIIGTFVGLFSIRVKDLYLALITLAAQFIIPWIIIEYFGGDRGMFAQGISFESIFLSRELGMYYFSLMILIVTTYFVFNIGRTKYGRAFKAIAHKDIPAQAMGININYYKVLSFTIGCFIAGVVGALWAIWMGRADIEHFKIMDSVWYMAIILLGGMGTVLGPYVGAILVLGVSELGDRLLAATMPYLPGEKEAYGALPTIAMALVILIVIIREPRGIYFYWTRFKEYYRVWPWAHW